LALPEGGGDLSAQRLVVIHVRVGVGDGPKEPLDLPIAVLHAEE